MANGDLTPGPSGVPRITIYPPGQAGAGGYGGLAPIGEEGMPSAPAQGFGGLVPIGAEAETPAAIEPPKLKQPTPTTSTSQRLLTDFLNQQQAAAQRTTPITAAQKPFEIGPALQNEEGDIGYADEKGQFVPTDRNKHVLLTDPADNVPKVYLRNAQTQEGLAASTGRLLGTGMGAGNIQFSGPLEAARRAAEAAQRIGVSLPTALVSPGRQFLGQVVAGQPGGAPLREAIDASRAALEGAVGRAGELTGGTPGAVGAGERFAETAQQAIKPPRAVPGGPPIARPASRLGRAGGLVSDAYADVEAMIDPNLRRPLPNTMAAASDIVARRGASGAPGFGKAVNEVTEAATRPEGLTFAGIKDLRSRIGEMLDTGIFPEGMSQAELRRLYGALSDDLRSVAAASGRPALVAFERANRLNKLLEDWKDRLRGILGTAPAGESIYNRILRMASTAPGSADLRGLALARQSVPAPVWQDIAATVISRLGRNAAGEWSPARFLTDYGKLSSAGKTQLFGGLGIDAQQLSRFLDDIVEVSNKFVEGGRLANVSRTAGHVTGPLAVIEALKGAAGGSWKEPLAVIAALIGNNALARALARPATAASLARWANSYERIVERGGPVAVPLFVRATNNFINTLNGELGTDVRPAEELLPGLKQLPTPFAPARPAQ